MELAQITTIATISLMAAMSPGPDFAIVVKNCLSGNFRSGFLTTLGVTCALFVHITYCLFGIALVIMESPALFYLLKYLGAAYLFYLGVTLLREKISSTPLEANKEPVRSGHNAFVSGLLCNLLNPKATLFIMSLFTQFIDPAMDFWSRAALGSIIALVALVWFSLLSFLITHHLLQKHFARFQLIISKTMGVALCLLALFVAFFS